MILNNPYLLFKKKHILFWIFFPILSLLSITYGFVLCILKFAYKKKILPTYRPKFKVVSVGNVTLGGTGKTPLVEWIVGCLFRNKKKAGIIIRGYKRPKLKERGIIKKDNSYSAIGDEASMLKEKLGDINICIGRDKIKSARQLEKEKCDIAVLDDGFQHWRLIRDLDIVTIDTSSSIFSQKLLPLGRLREPLSSLKRADIFVLTKTDLSEDNTGSTKEELKKINPGALIVSSIYQPLCFCSLKTGEVIALDSERFIDKPVFILSGIANPIYFDRMICELKLRIKRELIYQDHYQYRKNDLDFINRLAKDVNVNTIITTHKDAVRLRYLLEFFENIDVFYLRIQLKITENEEKFCNRLLSVANS